MPSKQHTHTVIRIKSATRTDLFMCADPDCSWNSRKELLYGKKSICPYCETPFLLDSRNLRLAKPWCGMCDKKPLTVTDAAKLKAEKILLEGLE